MISCDVLAAAVYGAMAIVRAPAGLIAPGSAAALLHMPFGPASRAAVPNLVPNHELSWPNGTLAAAGNVGSLVGPALGGALFAFVGARIAFWANAVSFILSAALMSTVHGRFHVRKPGSGHQGGIWAGVQFIGRKPTLLTLTAVGAVTFIATEVATVADLPLVHTFGFDGAAYGIMLTVWGTGGLVGGLVAARIVTKELEPAAAVFGVLVFGALVAAVSLSPWFYTIPALMFVLAFADSFAFVGFTGIYQRGTPDEIRGRVFAAVGGIMTLATALSFTFAGFLVQAIGWRRVYGVGGLIDVACALILGLALRGRGRSERALP